MVTFSTTTPTKNTRMLTIAGQTFPGYAWEKARENAKAKGIKVYPGKTLADWKTNSYSEVGRYHTVNGRCDCTASGHKLLCMHLAAVRSAQMKAGLMRQCAVCHAWDYKERMEQVAPNEWVCLACPTKPAPPIDTPEPTRKIKTLEELFKG